MYVTCRWRWRKSTKGEIKRNFAHAQMPVPIPNNSSYISGPSGGLNVEYSMPRFRVKFFTALLGRLLVPLDSIIRHPTKVAMPSSRIACSMDSGLESGRPNRVILSSIRPEGTSYSTTPWDCLPISNMAPVSAAVPLPLHLALHERKRRGADHGRLLVVIEGMWSIPCSLEQQFL